MEFPEREIQTKDGRKGVLRSARAGDAAELLEYLRVTASETPYLVSEPEETAMTLEQEEAFLAAIAENPRELMLVAFLDGLHAGNCSIMALGSKGRLLHRCSIGMALYQKYHRLGIGRELLAAALEQAKALGYEQAELEVVTSNAPAIALYRRMGFEIWGTLKHGMKYRDGSYADLHIMGRYL